jgi:hypothetical protein
MEDWMKVRESYKPKPKPVLSFRPTRKAQAFLDKFKKVEQRAGVTDAVSEILDRFERLWEKDQEAGLERISRG